MFHVKADNVAVISMAKIIKKYFRTHFLLL